MSFSGSRLSLEISQSSKTKWWIHKSLWLCTIAFSFWGDKSNKVGEEWLWFWQSLVTQTLCPLAKLGLHAKFVSSLD